MKSVLLLFIFSASFAWSQANLGELRLKVVDPAGNAVRASVEIESQGNGYDKTFVADPSGIVQVQSVPYGEYRITVRQTGFAVNRQTLTIRSALPLMDTIQLGLAPVVLEVDVSATDTLLNEETPSSVMQIGGRQIAERTASLPGRSLQDLVTSQPGWIYEGNAVLHPRGSEYQTQYVVDGIPLTDNRSPSFGPEIAADDVDAMSVYTAGFPAEFGRKMGGVINLDTRRPEDPGLHGRVVAGGGSYNTVGGYGELMDVWGRNAAGASAAGSTTQHYLNPVVPQNYTNAGHTGDFSARYERQFSGQDRLSLSVRHEYSSFQVPNELIQQEAGQLQEGGNSETMGIVRYQHIVSPQTLVAMSGMVRDNSDDLRSNANSIPILAFQNNSFREGYFKATVSHHRGRHEFKAGVESDALFLNERFNYSISDPDYFDPSTPPSLSFAATRPDLEQSAFAEDQMHAGNWTLSAGLRWDHYQLLLNENALSPRITLGRFVPAWNMTLHASYDRVFQTPSFANILISSSPQITSLNDNFLRLPVKPSLGNYYEGGMTKSVFGRARVDANMYRRDVRDFADDDQLLNTGVSYPISFSKAVIYGAEGKVTLANLGRLTGYASYSYMVSAAWLPVTGGLFLGDEADAATSGTQGHFPATQDQRNTVATRIGYQLTKRIWAAGGARYGSGLPFQYSGTEEDAEAQYGPEVVSRINFARGRVQPQFSADASLGVDLYEGPKLNLHLQADGQNLTDRLNVINFGGLFSGNAIGPGRTAAVRLEARF
jgi:hypothetical protein